MRICGLSLSDSNFGIQWHIVAMYGPSFFTGALIARFGAPAVVATGLALVVLETHRLQERNKVQAFNDFLVFGLMAIGSFSSGQVLANYGWSTVNMVVFPPILIGFVALVMAGVVRRRQRMMAAGLPDMVA
jgi:hypothetical protein